MFAALAMPESTMAQQTQTDSTSSVSHSPHRELVEEWVYRVQDGHKDEWFRIFKKYQLAILERQKQLGYVKQYTIWRQSAHQRGVAIGLSRNHRAHIVRRACRPIGG